MWRVRPVFCQNKLHANFNTLKIRYTSTRRGTAPPDTVKTSPPRPGRPPLPLAAPTKRRNDSTTAKTTKKTPKGSFIHASPSTPSPLDKWRSKGYNQAPINHILPSVYSPRDSQILELPWGRQLGWARQGRQKDVGPVWLFFHGTPGSRFSGRHLSKYCERYGIRVITVDRDGYGNSVLGKAGNPSGNVFGFMRAIEYLLDVQGIDRFKVVGVSGGGPYALAAARYFPSKRLQGTAIMCGVGHPRGEKKSIEFKRRMSEFHAWLSPLTFKWSKGHTIQRWREMLASPNSVVGEPKDPGKEEQYKQGTGGHTGDIAMTQRHWGFEIEDIRASPIMWYYGRLDANCSISAVEYTVGRMQGRTPITLHDLPERDHYTAQRDIFELADWLRKM